MGANSGVFRHCYSYPERSFPCNLPYYKMEVFFQEALQMTLTELHKEINALAGMLTCEDVQIYRNGKPFDLELVFVGYGDKESFVEATVKRHRDESKV